MAAGFNAASLCSSFQKGAYETIEAGRKLNPTDHPFENQSEISPHLQNLASLNRIEFEKMKNTLSIEQLRYSQIEADLKTLEVHLKTCKNHLKLCERKLKTCEGTLKTCVHGIPGQWCLNELWEVGDAESDRYVRMQENIIEENFKSWHVQLRSANVLSGPVGATSAAYHHNAILGMGIVHRASEHETRITKAESCLLKARPAFDGQVGTLVGAKSKNFTAQWDQTVDAFYELTLLYQRILEVSYQAIGKMRKRLSALRLEEKRCIAASKLYVLDSNC